MPISIYEGEATIFPFASNLVGRFLGSTSDEGIFPLAGLAYSAFSFAPAVGSEGILVFGDYTLKNHFRFYPFFWKDGKLVVKEGELSNRLEAFSTGSGEDNFGLMVRTKTHVYVTNVPKDSSAAYRLVDPVALMKYVDCKITIEQLHRNARTVKDRAKRAETLACLKEANRLLEESLSLHQSRRSEREHTLEKKVRVYENLLKDLIRKLKESILFSIFFPSDLAVRVHELDIAQN